MGVGEVEVRIGMLRMRSIWDDATGYWLTNCLPTHLGPGVCQPITQLNTSDVILDELISGQTLHVARGFDGRQWLVDRVSTWRRCLPIVAAVKELCVLDGHWWLLARHCWEIVAIVHLVHINHLLTTAHAGLVAYARHVAFSASYFICVVEKRCAIALVAVAKTEEL